MVGHVDPADATTPETTVCSAADHGWVPVFFESGRLAYWKCATCGLTDREAGDLPERLDRPAGPGAAPPAQPVRGARPPSSARRWRTTDGNLLLQGEPCSVHFEGVPIPDLTESHAYELREAADLPLATFAPSRERLEPHAERFVLTRFQVVEHRLLRFASYCREESTYDTPDALRPERTVVLSDLIPIATEPEPAADVRRDVLGLAAAQLHAIGSANDAEDHGCADDAKRMRIKACASLRSLLENNPFLRRVLPALDGELTTGRILGSGWSTLLDVVEAQPDAGRK